MRGILQWLIILVLFFMTACTQTQDAISNNESKLTREIQKLTDRLNEKEEQIKELTKSNEELTNKIDSFIQEKETFTLISNLSREFVQAQKTGDKEILKKLLSDDLILVEKDNKLYVKINGNNFEWFLYDSQSDSTFDDWVIQGYQYDNEADTFRVHIRVFYSDMKGESVSPPTFLNLWLKQQENEWKIISLDFDV